MNDDPSTARSVAPRSSARPRRDHRPGVVTSTARIASIAATAVLVVVTLVAFPTLPETIPTHFGITGEADGWGPRSSTFALTGIMALVIAVTSWLSFHPEIFNYPVTVTDENAQQLYRVGEQTVVWVTAAVVVLFCGLTASTFLGVNTSWFMGTAIVGLVLAIGTGIVRMLRA